MAAANTQMGTAVLMFLSLGMGITAVATGYWFHLTVDSDKGRGVADFGLWGACASDANHTICQGFTSGGGFWIRAAQFDGVVYILFALVAIIATIVWGYRASRDITTKKEPRLSLTFSILAVIFLVKCCFMLFMLSATVKAYMNYVIAHAGVSLNTSQTIGYSCYAAITAIIGHIAALVCNVVTVAKATPTTQFEFKTFA